jgi:L-ascorbate metabolism protein UlaG (beta-lactamase superfamily)
MILESMVLILMLILIVGMIFINFSPQFGAKTTGVNYERIKISNNFKNGKFRNIEKTAIMTKMDLTSLFKYFIKGNTVPNFTIPIEKSYSIKSDDLDTTVVNNNLDSYKQKSNVKVTWFGHSALLLEVNNRKILLDPMLGKIPAPHPWLGSKRFNEELPMKIEDIPQIDAVLISHDHYDHLDYWSITKIKDKVKMFYVPLGIAAHLKSWGVDESRIIELDWWEEAEFQELTFVSTPSRHFSGRGLFNKDSTLWCSWVIKNENTKIFFSGDGGYSKTFKEIGEKFGPFDLTFLECGQYNEGWSEIHMMPEETVQAHIDLRGELLMPIHLGAFKLSIHPWQEPAERLLLKANPLKVKITTPMIGDPITLGKSVPSSKWWKNKPY